MDLSEKLRISSPKIIDGKELTLGNKDVAVLIRNAASNVKVGIEERDAAIKIDSLGASVLVYKNNILRFPRADESKINNDSIMGSFEFKEEDVLIIGTDNTYDKAENAAIAALLTIIDDKIAF